MKMSIRTRRAALAAALVASFGLSMSAMAADGTINITGKVLDQTCQISTGYGNGTTVVLTPVSASTFTSSGQTANPTDFSVEMTSCPTTPTGVQVAATFSGNGIDPTTHNLKNTGTATGVQVALLDQGGSTPLALDTDTSAWQNIGNNGTASLPFTAEYISTANTVDAGSVSSSVDFTVVYQ